MVKSMKGAGGNVGFTMIELLTVIAVLAVLIALAVPAFQRVKEASHATTCVSNLRTLCGAVMAYAADHQGKFPEDTRPGAATTMSWYIPLRDYLPGEEGKKVSPYFCPANPSDYTAGSPKWTNYAINRLLYQDASGLFSPSLRISQLAGTKALLMDSWQKDATPYTTYYLQSGNRGGWRFADPVHRGRVNLVFTDGHVKSLLVEPRVIDSSGNLGELQTRWFWPVQR